MLITHIHDKIRHLALFIASTLLFSCSLVKNPNSSNFSRVKYNAHLKTAKNLKKETVVSTVSSFQLEEELSETSKTKLAHTDNTTTKLEKLKRSDLSKLKSDSKVEPRINSIAKLNDLLKEKVEIPVPSKVNYFQADKFDDGWWNDDPEDWPWLEIALAFIGFLLVCILIILFVDLVGGLIGSFLGLIFLVALAYLLYIWWV